MAPSSVLIIECEQSVIDALQAWFGERGVQVYLASDGVTGIQEAYRRDPTVIILAVELPTLSGYSVCKKLKRTTQTTDIPLVLISSTATPETFEQHKKLRTHADHYLSKPISPEALWATVRPYLDSSGGGVEREQDGDFDGALGEIIARASDGPRGGAGASRPDLAPPPGRPAVSGASHQPAGSPKRPVPSPGAAVMKRRAGGSSEKATRSPASRTRPRAGSSAGHRSASSQTRPRSTAAQSGARPADGDAGRSSGQSPSRRTSELPTLPERRDGVDRDTAERLVKGGGLEESRTDADADAADSSVQVKQTNHKLKSLKRAPGDSLRLEVNILMEQIERQEKAYRELLKAYEALEQSHGELSSRSGGQAQAVARLESRLQERQSALAEREARIDKLESRFERARTQYNRQVRAWSEERESLTDQVDGLEDRLRVSESRLAAAGAEIEGLRIERDGLQEQLERVREPDAPFDASPEGLGRALRAVQAQRDELDAALVERSRRHQERVGILTETLDALFEVHGQSLQALERQTSYSADLESRLDEVEATLSAIAALVEQVGDAVAATSPDARPSRPEPAELPEVQRPDVAPLDPYEPRDWGELSFEVQDEPQDDAEGEPGAGDEADEEVVEPLDLDEGDEGVDDLEAVGEAGVDDELEPVDGDASGEASLDEVLDSGGAELEELQGFGEEELDLELEGGSDDALDDDSLLNSIAPILDIDEPAPSGLEEAVGEALQSGAPAESGAFSVGVMGVDTLEPNVDDVDSIVEALEDDDAVEILELDPARASAAPAGQGAGLEDLVEGEEDLISEFHIPPPDAGGTSLNLSVETLTSDQLIQVEDVAGASDELMGLDVEGGPSVDALGLGEAAKEGSADGGGSELELFAFDDDAPPSKDSTSDEA